MDPMMKLKIYLNLIKWPTEKIKIKQMKTKFEI